MSQWALSSKPSILFIIIMNTSYNEHYVLMPENLHQCWGLKTWGTFIKEYQ